MNFQVFGNPYRVAPLDVFARGTAALLPEAYHKFYDEWKETPEPVHYVPRAGRYTRNEATGIVTPVQNVPIPLKYPLEFENCLLGGEAVVKGHYKTRPRIRRFPHFWIPNIKRTIVYSEILNNHMEVLATERAIQLINHYKGFDEYIMQVCLIAVGSIRKPLIYLIVLYGTDKSMRFENETRISDKTAHDQGHP